MKRVLLCLLAVLLCVGVFSGCAKHEYKVGENARIVLNGETAKYVDGSTEEILDNIKVKFEIENGGVFVMELYPKYAPETVANFKSLVEEGFYDGLTFHRIIKGFMIQGGDPLGNGMGGSDKNIKGEFKMNGFDNPLKHTRGVISMARSQMPNSASSQFFIMHEDAPHLDGSYAAFGKVTKGIEVVDAIAEVETNGMDKPYDEQKMKKVTLF